MKDKIVNWFMDNRLAIGYTVGGINVLSGIADIAFGNVGLGILWIIIGSVIIYDTKATK